MTFEPTEPTGSSRSNERREFAGPACPSPIRNYANIVLGHGGGGKLSGELVEHLFLPAFNNEHLAKRNDSSVLDVGDQRVAFSTDSFVVRPLFFPGGNIGNLAVNGTVNDLAMAGATPSFLSAGFILEEGMDVASLEKIVETMGRAARNAGVQIVTGDTKVVERGHGDGCYINTAGIGIVADKRRLSADQAAPGDVVILSGCVGEHGMAIMSVREGLQFDAELRSDTASLHRMVSDMLTACPDIRVLRDPTRGGVASALNEIAASSNVGVVFEEAAVPRNPAVEAACELLGLDSLFVANEGKLLAIVPAADAGKVLDTMHSHVEGADACVIGRIVDEHPQMVVARTTLGTQRVITMQIGEQLPRIC